MSYFLICCGGICLIIALIYLPIFLLRKGFDLLSGCLGNSFVLIIVAILLVIYVLVTDVDICQTYFVGEPLCSFMNQIGWDL